MFAEIRDREGVKGARLVAKSKGLRRLGPKQSELKAEAEGKANFYYNTKKEIILSSYVLIPTHRKLSCTLGCQHPFT